METRKILRDDQMCNPFNIREKGKTSEEKDDKTAKSSAAKLVKKTV